MSLYVLGAVFARGGSKGVPGKNLRVLAGKPLVGYAVEAARASSLVSEVIVSTDDPRIAQAAREYGAEAPFMRPAELAADDSPELWAWQHAVREMELQRGRRIDVLASVPCTAPLREAADVDACVTALVSSDADLVITVTPAARHPAFNMVTVDPSGYAQRVITAKGTTVRRQDVAPVFDITTVAYAVRRDFLLGASSLWDGKVKAVQVPAERALDIDSEWDLLLARLVLEHRAQEGGTSG